MPSAATRVPLSIIEMGMVEKVEIAAGAVVVALRMTSPLCHALPYFQMESSVSSPAFQASKASNAPLTTAAIGNPKT